MGEQFEFGGRDYSTLLSSIQLAADQSTDGLTHLNIAAPRPSHPIGLGCAARGAHLAVSAAPHVLLADPTTIGVEAAALALLDGARPSDLPKVQTGLGTVFQWRGLRCIEWTMDDPERIERRAVHARSLSLLDAKGLLSSAGITDLLQNLAQFLDEQALYGEFPRSERVAEFERDLLCWWYQVLPMPLFFHVSGLQPLSAVTRACLASADTHLVPEIKSVEMDEAGGISCDDESCTELLDIASVSTGSDASAIVLKQALEHISISDIETDAVAKRRWIGALLGLRLVAARTGPITALLLAWSIDLIESGTVKQSNPPKTTPYTYIHRALLPLFDALRELPGSPDTWNVDVLADVYEVLILSQAVGSQGNMASALTSFHRFLETWFDVAPLRRSLHADVPLPAVRAIVIWSHRLELARSWIPMVTDDPILAGAIEVVLAIAGESPSRAKELAFLRLGNIKDWRSFIEVEIAPSWASGRLKTPSSQRRLIVMDPKGMAVIRRWLLAREALGTGPGTLLFAGPIDRSTVYRRADMSRAIARLLRAASGDPEAVGYSLRHTVISMLNESVLMTSSISDINRFRQVAVVSGHATGTTTFLSYSHLYERALRGWLDAALILLVPLNSRDAASVAGLREAALRQRACRLRTDTALLGWALMRESAAKLKLPDAGADRTWVEPSPPPLLSHAKAPFGPSVTLMLLRHLVFGRTPTEVATGFMLETADVQRLADCAMKVIKSVAACIWVRRAAASRSIPIDLGDALKRLAIDLSEAADDKFDWLQIWLQDERPTQLLEAAVGSWRACRSGLYLGLDVARDVIGLYRLLAASSINPVLLRVCVRPTGSDKFDADLKTIVERDFITAFGVRPRTIPARPRARVAQAYLQFDSVDTMERHHGRAGSLKGLDVLMLAVAVHLEWKKGVMP